MKGPPLVALKDVPPVPDQPPGVAGVWPPLSRDFYRGRRVEVWWQIEPGGWFFVRDQGPNVMLSKRDLRERSKDPNLWVISIEDYLVPLPDGRQPPHDILRYLADRPLVVGP